MIKYSIIVATYNNNAVLKYLLDSLIACSILTKKNVEMIVSQNDSDIEVFKETLKLISGFKNKNIVTIHVPKGGKATALNEAVKIARGEYCAFTDDDVEIADASWLKKLEKPFKVYSKLGYSSGRVAINPKYTNASSSLWERKGGLSKGEASKYWDRKYINKLIYKFRPLPLYKMCAGANFMMRTNFLKNIGLFTDDLGGGRAVLDGMTLEVGHRVAKYGHELHYSADAIVFHRHPQNEKDVKKKLYYYGKQDTAYPMYIFLRERDFRYLLWALFGHPIYTVSKMFKRIVGKYPLPISYILYGLWGNCVGWGECLYVLGVRKWKRKKVN